ncbi:hypothetical protein Tco_0760108, partial [Tanacetum coccineum]
MAEYSQKWHNGTSRSRSTETSDGLAAIQAQLNNLGREIKKVNEKVYAAQVGCEQCKGPHYTKDCPLKEEGKTLEEAYYTQFSGPFQGGGYRAATLGFYQRNNFHNSIMKDKMVYTGNNVIGALMNVPIFVGTFSIVMDFAVLENMDAYRDEGMSDANTFRASRLKKVMADKGKKSSMETFAPNDKANYYSKITSITVNGKNAYELKGKFLDDLYNNAFSGTNEKYVAKHIEYFHKIVGLINLPNVDHDKLRVVVFPILLKIGGDEIEVSDDESSDLEEYWSDKEETAKNFKIETDVFYYETPLAFNEFNYLLKVDPDLLTKDIMGWREDGYYNGENFPGAYVIGNTLHYQDLEWYEALEDSELKDGALRNKAIMEGLICDDESSNDYEEEYVVVKEYEYNDLTITSEEACRAYQEIFRMMDEGWMDLVKEMFTNIGREFTNLEILKCWSLETSRRLFNMNSCSSKLNMENLPSKYQSNYEVLDIFTKGALWDYWQMGGDEIEVSNDESSDLEEYWSDKEETTKIFKIETDVFDYKTSLCLAFNEFNYLLKVDPDLLTKDIMVWREDGYCNRGNFPSAYVIGNSLHYQDLEWYEALEDSKLKYEALRNKAIIEGLISDDESSMIVGKDGRAMRFTTKIMMKENMKMKLMKKDMSYV